MTAEHCPTCGQPMPIATLLLGGAALLALKEQKREAGEPEWFIGKPLESVIVTEGWGAAREGRPAHGGVDLRAKVGTPVLAASSGKVRFAGAFADGSGRAIELEHGDGMVTRYLHLDSLVVKSGDVVARGAVIAGTGFPPRSPNLPHLHFDCLVRPPQVEFYRARFSDAKLLGAVTITFHGVTLCKVPVEPLLDVDGYQDDVVRCARLFAVKLREGAPVVA